MVRDGVVCPDCRHALVDHSVHLSCSGCDKSFPVVNDIPVLLPENSVFSIEQVAAVRDTYYARKASESSLKQRVRKSLPKLTGAEHSHAHGRQPVTRN